MMRIPLKFVNGRILVLATLSAPNYRVSLKPVWFVVDTGSAKSFLSEGEALRLQIPMESLSLLEPIRMGGATYQLYRTKQVKLFFKNDQNGVYTINLENFALSRTGSKKEASKRESENFPSILGTDFLIKNNLALYFDPVNNEAYLIVKTENSLKDAKSNI